MNRITTRKATLYLVLVASGQSTGKTEVIFFMSTVADDIILMNHGFMVLDSAKLTKRSQFL
jgi:hypothetical protein